MPPSRLICCSFLRKRLIDEILISVSPGNECPYLILRVRRENLIRDTLLQISALHSQHEDLKKPLKVIFKVFPGFV